MSDSNTPPTAPKATAPKMFADLGLDARLVAALAAKGYTEPTPIQRESIPVLLEGKDLIGLAATGTGKTAAFALPMLHKLNENPNRERPGALVLVPTRELAIQVANAIAEYGAPLKIKVVAVYGGSGFAEQTRAIRAKADVVVATPGRALDHIRRGTVNFGNIQMVVLDEADEMLDMGFAEDLDAILTETPKERQTALFSATMPPRIAQMAAKHQNKPVRVEVQKAKLAAGEAPKVRELVYLVQRDYKAAALARVLDFEAPTAALVFCRTRADADGVADTLNGRGYRPESIHGGLTQDQRDRVMRKFREGSVRVLVATDVAARGLDIDHLSHVINFNVPEAAETYVHRIGRTGRAGREGVAITLAEPRERFLLQSIERLTGRRFNTPAVPTKADLLNRRLERTREEIREALTAGGIEKAQALLEPLLKDFKPNEVALATAALLVKLTHPTDDGPDIPSPHMPQNRPAPSSYNNSGPSRPPFGRNRPMDNRGGPGRPRQGGNNNGPSNNMSDMTKVFIGAGRETGVGRRDLMTTLENELGLSSKDIGNIDVADRFSLVEVPGELAEHVISSLQGVRFRGRSVVVRLDKAGSAV